MKLEIITPSKSIFSGEASLVQLPGLDGLFEVLEHHAPLVSALKKGTLKVQSKDNEVQYFDINGGVVEVLQDKVLVLAE